MTNRVTLKGMQLCLLSTLHSHDDTLNERADINEPSSLLSSKQGRTTLGEKPDNIYKSHDSVRLLQMDKLTQYGFAQLRGQDESSFCIKYRDSDLRSDVYSTANSYEGMLAMIRSFNEDQMRGKACSTHREQKYLFPKYRDQASEFESEFDAYRDQPLGISPLVKSSPGYPADQLKLLPSSATPQAGSRSCRYVTVRAVR
ncbi:hypothetical protein CIB48_g4714 [Xylaria polymorpha]|nr:hypothetical protein CIB48_g4714 [Xylaria polymorpha]